MRGGCICSSADYYVFHIPVPYGTYSTVTKRERRVGKSGAQKEKMYVKSVVLSFIF